MPEKCNELKPCPFCGGVAKHNHGGNSVYGRLWWSVYCDECGHYICDREEWLKDQPMLDPDYPPKECFKRWNTRPIEAQLEQELAEAKKALKRITCGLPVVDTWDNCAPGFLVGSMINYRGYAHEVIDAGDQGTKLACVSNDARCPFPAAPEQGEGS